MMEVKQNTAVDLNELLAPPKSVNGTDELDDAIMADLSEETANKELNCDLSKVDEKSNNVLVVANGNTATLSPLMDIDDVGDATGLDEELPVSTEMEDALLAEDDALPIVNSNNVLSNDLIPPPTISEEDLLADKVETSNSTTTSSNDRDPGDDLDTLLSKINDIVDDCLDKDGGGSVTPANVEEKEPEKASEKVPETAPEEEKIVSDITIEDKKEENSISEIDSSVICLDESEEIVDVPEPESSKTQKAEEEAKELKELKETETIEDSLLIEETIVEESLKEISKDTENEIKEKISDDITKTSTDQSEESPQIVDDNDEENKEELLNKDLDENSKESSILPDDPEKPTEENVSNKVDDEKVTIEEDQLSSNADPVVLLEKEEEECKIQKDPEENNQKESMEIDSSNKESEEKLLNEKSPDEEQPMEESKDNDDLLKPQETEDEKRKNLDKESQKINKNEEQQPEESDDEIVFYVDEKQQEEAEKKPQNEKEESLKTDKTEEKIPKEVGKETPEDQTKSSEVVDIDDDVVILDDDDEVPEEETNKKSGEAAAADTTPSQSENTAQGKTLDDSKKEEEENQKKSTADISDDDNIKKHSTNLDVDNSDNARDDFVTEKVSSTTEQEGKLIDSSSASIAPECPGNKPQEMEETNSNCSSSSNLLLEAKANNNSGDGGEEANNNQDENDNDNENEEEDDDGDVELIENESKEGENGSEKGEEFAPPAKRPRLSDDSLVSSNIDESSNRSLKTLESLEEKSDTPLKEISASSGTSALKRPHDVIELEMDEKSNDSKISNNTETLNKKPRTEERSQSLNDLKEKTKKEEDEKLKEEDKQLGEDKKMIPSHKPIPLYPPPKFETLKSETTISLDFLKKFRKSFDKMTKQDLEEMVLQKVVEAIIHKSEFAEMRELIEKQEKLIASHRTKITELSKQFRDLEMVHNRVVKDIEQRNSQFIMPVKITRAVGLQVYIPNKKTIMESSQSSTSPGSANVSSSPQRPMAAAPASSQTSLTSPQRPMVPTPSSSALSTADVRSINALTNAVSSAISNAVRRGCAQKITPTRPVPGSTSSTSGSSAIASSGNTSIYRTNSSNSSQSSQSSQPRILNKNAATASVVGGSGSSASNSAANIQRNRYTASSMDSMRMQQQQQAAAARGVSSAASQRMMSQKPSTTPNTVVPRRSDPTATGVGSNNTSSLDSYMNTLSQLTGGNTAVSITPAKPKEKAVIDLTDEDELAPGSGSNTNTVIGPMRRSLPTPNNQNTNSNTQYGRNAPPLARIPPINQGANSNKNRPGSQQGPKTNNSSSYSSTISTPAGTSITRINVSSAQNSQRVKYSHPAPLPATPPQAFNPTWKLPPPRPTIRISNLDNGIVISWTMEESMDRHAECVSYQIYAYQETSGPPMADSWRHVGDVKAMLLPMAVTLTQFQEGQRYFFAVRAVDCHQRYGPFSLPKTWS